MDQAIVFLGRFHVLLLHVPLGVLVLAIGMEALSRWPRFHVDGRSPLDPALPLVWAVGALSAVATVALGYFHAQEPGFTGAGVNQHRWAGTALALFAVLIWAWRGDAPRSFARVWPASLAVLVALLLVTGHLGGALTHGADYLTEVARPGARVAARPRVTDPARADVYLDVVAPLLADKCSGCHNENKRRGGLSLDSYAALRAGGESGEVVRPGDPDGSELFRRITLPETSDEYMPKNHKSRPTASDVELLRWWIGVGAPGSGVVGDLEPPPSVTGALGRRFGSPLS